MLLHEYIEKRKKTERGFHSKYMADDLGITASHLSNLASCSAGDATRMTFPSLELAVKIEDYTEGSVPVRSWLEIDKK